MIAPEKHFVTLNLKLPDFVWLVAKIVVRILIMIKEKTIVKQNAKVCNYCLSCTYTLILTYLNT